MNTSFLTQTRSWMLTLAVAIILALSATYGSVLLDGLTGTTFTPATFACQHQSGSCGG